MYFNGQWFTYADLERRATQLAGHLSQNGIKRGDRVAILAYNHICHVDLMLAAPKLGFVYTPLNFRLSDAEQREIVDYLKPDFVFHDRRHAEQADRMGCPAEALDGYNDWLATAPAVPIPPPLGPDDTHMLLQTGGSTGVVKGACIPYRQVMFNALNTIPAWGIRDTDCAIQATPAFHAAVNVLTLPLLYAGGRVIWMPVFDPNEYLTLSVDQQATLWFMVPTMFQILAEHPDFEYTSHEHVRWAISGGAACPEPVRKAMAEAGISFRQGYGLTEAGVNCFAMSPEDGSKRPDSVGKPLITLQAVVRRPDGSRCASDEIGELTLRGAQVFTGYFERPQETDEVLRDGWLWTGDLASVDKNGFFYLRGRRKDLFISGGENVYPKEIEDALYELDGIAECAVVGIPDSRWGETGLAAIVLSKGGRWDREELIREMRMRVAAYKVPREFIFVDELPRNAAGKVKKFQLRKIYENMMNEVSVGV